jgi:hypothetical protein
VTGCLSLVGFIIFYVLTTCLFLQFIPGKISLAKEVGKVGRDSGPVEAIAYTKISTPKPATIAVRLVDLKLSVETYVRFRKTILNILQGITVDFEPGELNVVMGPSGMSPDFRNF